MAFTTVATTANFNQLVGKLFETYPNRWPLLEVMGINMNNPMMPSTAGFKMLTGLNSDFEYGWRTKDKRAPTQTAEKENAALPAISSINQVPVINVIQIFKYKFGVTFLKEQVSGRKTGDLEDSAAGKLTSSTVENSDAYASELRDKMIELFDDYEYSVAFGTYANPNSDPVSTAPKMKGLATAIASNVSTNSGTARAISETLLKTLYKQVAMNGGFAATGGQNLKLMAPAFLMDAINDIYGVAIRSEVIGGVTIKYINTSFGRIELVFNSNFDRASKSGQVFLLNGAELTPVCLPINGQIASINPIAKTNDSSSFFVYSTLGYEWGNEKHHGSISDLKSTSTM